MGSWTVTNHCRPRCSPAVVANIWAEDQMVEETLSTCRFAQRMMRISNEVVQNVRQESSVYIRKLEKEIEDLKQELALHDSFANRAQVSYDAYSGDQRAKASTGSLR